MRDSSKKSSGLTKWGVGCGFALIILVLVLGIGGYFAVKFVGGKIAGANSSLRQLSEIVTLDNDIVNQSSFTPPEDGLLSLEQVETLVYVQRQISDAIDPDQEKLLRQFIDLAKETDRTNDLRKLPKLISLSRKLVGPLHRAKEAQIEAINREGISKEEYEWLKAEAMMVFDIPIARFNLRSLLEASEKASEAESGTLRLPVVLHPQNRLLLENHEALLRETLPLSAVGL